MGEFEIGEVIANHYRVVRRLGTGGFGTVHLVEDLYLPGELFALKTLDNVGRGQDAQRLLRFQREARVSLRLVHRNIVTIRHFFRTDELTCYTMDYVEGPTLGDLLKRRRRVVPARAALRVRDVLAALAEAHRRGVVHRDIKPENVLIAEAETLSEHAKVLDFGIAKLMGPTTIPTGQTEQTAIIGTPAYMSPEQGRGWRVDGRSDLYSVGCILFELLTGRRPFVSENQFGYLIQHSIEPLPTFAEVAPALRVPGGLEDVVRRAMEKHPEDRFSSAQAMIEAIEAIGLEWDGPAERPPSFETERGAPAPEPDPARTTVRSSPPTISDRLTKVSPAEEVVFRTQEVRPPFAAVHAEDGPSPRRTTAVARTDVVDGLSGVADAATRSVDGPVWYDRETQQLPAPTVEVPPPAPGLSADVPRAVLSRLRLDLPPVASPSGIATLFVTCDPVLRFGRSRPEQQEAASGNTLVLRVLPCRGEEIDPGSYRATRWISSGHATIEERDGALWITDHSSRGTWIDGERLAKHEPVRLAPRFHLGLAGVLLLEGLSIPAVPAPERPVEALVLRRVDNLPEHAYLWVIDHANLGAGPDAIVELTDGLSARITTNGETLQLYTDDPELRFRACETGDEVGYGT